MARREVNLRLVGERVGDAVGRCVGVSDLLKGGRHLGDDPVAQRDSAAGLGMGRRSGPAWSVMISASVRMASRSDCCQISSPSW